MVKYTCKQEARVYLPSYVFAQISKNVVKLLGGFLQPNSWYRAWAKRTSRTLYIMAPFEAIFVEMFRVNHESSQRTEIGSMRSHESYPFVAVTLVFRTSLH